MAQAEAPPKAFKPYVASDQVIPEFTLLSIALGAGFGILFGAVTVYLGLKVGLTVSASIPIAVLSVSIYSLLGRLGSARGPFILRNNIVQTTGSAGESIAAGVVFTMPALIFLGFDLEISRIFLLALTGGWLGVLFMIPLRRYLIVKEHGNLLYPEGTACAEVLVAGEKGGSQAKKVFAGLGLGLVYKFMMGGLRFWKEAPEWQPRFYKGSTINGEISPELLGVGYIIGYRVAAIMVAGGVLSWLVLIPFIRLFGDSLTERIYPATLLIRDMTPAQIWSSYVRYIGAGAVATGGILNLIRALPTIADSFKASYRQFRETRQGTAQQPSRVEQDLPITVVVGGSVILFFIIWALLAFRINPGAGGNLVSSLMIVLFGFFFVTVSSRIVGLIGNSSNPISGMTIATLMATCLTFVAVGWTGQAYAAVALSIGAVVCIAAANAGATSQDLKTGFLVGATPMKQQIGLMIGVTASVLVIGWTMLGVNAAYTRVEAASFPDVTIDADLAALPVMRHQDTEYLVYTAIGHSRIPDGKYLIGSDQKIQYSYVEGIGSEKLPAPQARLMSLVINGILNQRLPWGLVLLGVCIAFVVELCGIHSLPFAVGAYLPLSTTSTIFVGGVIRRLLEGRGLARADEGEAGGGVLYSSGLIAGGALAGLGIAALAGFELDQQWDLGSKFLGGLAASDLFALFMFLVLCATLWFSARQTSSGTK